MKRMPWPFLVLVNVVAFWFAVIGASSIQSGYLDASRLAVHWWPRSRTWGDVVATVVLITDWYGIYKLAERGWDLAFNARVG